MYYFTDPHYFKLQLTVASRHFLNGTLIKKCYVWCSLGRSSRNDCPLSLIYYYLSVVKLIFFSIRSLIYYCIQFIYHELWYLFTFQLSRLSQILCIHKKIFYVLCYNALQKIGSIRSKNIITWCILYYFCLFLFDFSSL